MRCKARIEIRGGGKSRMSRGSKKHIGPPRGGGQPDRCKQESECPDDPAQTFRLQRHFARHGWPLTCLDQILLVICVMYNAGSRMSMTEATSAAMFYGNTYQRVASLIGGVLLFVGPLVGQASSSIRDLEATARQRWAAQDAAGALAAYEKLAVLVPNSAAYQDQIGFLLASTDRTADALPHFRRATELDPKMAQAWYHLGVALWLSKQADASMHALQRAATLAPDNGEYRFRLGSAYNET